MGVIELWDSRSGRLRLDRLRGTGEPVGLEPGARYVLPTGVVVVAVESVDGWCLPTVLDWETGQPPSYRLDATGAVVRADGATWAARYTRWTWRDLVREAR